MFMRNTLVMLCGLTAVFMVFDVLSNAGDITKNTENSLQTLWHYMGLRFPIIFVLIVPMAALLGAMLTMHKLVKDSEMVVIAAAGVSIYKVTGFLIIGACFFAVIQFSISEYMASSSSTRLRLWAAKDYVGVPPNAPEIDRTLWVASGDYIVHYNTVSPNGHKLTDLFVVRRTKDRLIDEYIRADRAFYEDSIWRLENAYGHSSQELGKSLLIDLDLHPDDFSVYAKNFAEIRSSRLWGLMFSDDPQSDLYSLWFQRKLAQPLGIILMVIMVAPMALFIPRRYNPLLVSFGFIMSGFVFFVNERLLLSLGESGALPSFLAIWSPLLIFGTMNLLFMLHKQE